MKIEITAKDYRVSDELEKVIGKKIAKLDKYFDDETKARVYLKKEKRTCKMEISMEHKGTAIRAEGKGENFYDIIDIVLPKLERQIHKHRSKLESKLREGAYKGDLVYEPAEEIEFKIVKSKQFEMPPMSMDEALEEFELSGHSFYVYYDIDSSKIKVLYLRDDGNVGVIDPIVNA